MRFSARYIFLIALMAGIIYQVMCAVLGFDMSDEGFVMTLYRDFCDGFDARKMGSGYPVACYIGWLFSYLTPGSLLAMRLWGILMISILFVMIYVFLKDKMNPKIVSVGLLCMAMVMGNDPKPLGYNNITVFFSTISLMLIVHGCQKRQWLSLVAGGMVIGLNTFVRLPNVLELSFAVVPFFAIDRTWRIADYKKASLQMLMVVIGGMVGGCLTWLFLCHTGADQNVIAFLETITGQLGGESSHSSSSMLQKLATNYLMAIEYATLYVAILVVIPLIHSIWRPLGIIASVLLPFLMYRSIYLNTNLLGDIMFAIINGIGIFGCLAYVIWGNGTQRVIGLAAALMSVVLPLGSDQGFVTMYDGPWLSLPVGLCGMMVFLDKVRQQIGKHDIRLFADGRSRVVTMNPKVCLWSFCLTTLAVMMVIGAKVYFNCYYDPGARFDKTYSIESSYAKGIYTAPDKAARFNPMLAELKKYVNAGDTLLVYEWSPMIYCLTETKPYAGIVWPCVFFGQAYVNEMDKQEKKSKFLPVVVLQNYHSVENLSPRNYYPNHYSNMSLQVMIDCINSFVVRHHYRRVWSNGWFEILLPPNKGSLSKVSNVR